MTPPHTPQPNCLQESVATDESTSTQVFGVMYITLTGLIDSMGPTSGPWAVLGKNLFYIIKLAPILWWALPAGPTGCPPASSQEPPRVGSLTPTPIIILNNEVDPTPKLFFSLGAPFGSINFIKYPVDLAYSKFTLENILFADPLARTRQSETYGCEGT
ncbi:hypothetical protein DSO57_1016510 [Entomophthora muscae]|uniref:Uncharacterized protein n=1 Tax=Entomophthora muscae TaxID=34485 RepID=A0ACC2UDP6_9FUNG|nr:hypothetical protein DSO57_1016510 [Entomophthora muscae]